MADDEDFLPGVIEAGLPEKAQELLVRREEPQPGECPVEVYLAGLAAGSRRSIRQGLDRMASMVMGNPPDVMARGNKSTCSSAMQVHPFGKTALSVRPIRST